MKEKLKIQLGPEDRKNTKPYEQKKYKESCLTHLKSKTETGEPYYKQIQPNSIKPMIKEIDKNLKSALTNKTLDRLQGSSIPE